MVVCMSAMSRGWPCRVTPEVQLTAAVRRPLGDTEWVTTTEWGEDTDNDLHITMLIVYESLNDIK